MFEFNLEGYRIGEVDEDEKSTGFGEDQLIDSASVTLTELLKQKDKIIYSYDFGDGWKHQIKIENFLKQDPELNYPICIDGKMSCPPEDCGGIDSFYYYIDAYENKDHADHEEALIVFDKKFDIKKFDKEKVNKRLKGLDAYIRKWIKGN